MQPQHYPKFVISNDDEEINGDKEYPSGKTTMFPSFCRIFFPKQFTTRQLLSGAAAIHRIETSGQCHPQSKVRNML